MGASVSLRLSSSTQNGIEPLKTAVDKVRSLVAEYGLTESDVFPPARGTRSVPTAGTKVAPKYRDPATGATWTGRGKAPKWIDGQEREKFAI